MAYRDLSNLKGNDIIDSRDLIARLRELEDDRATNSIEPEDIEEDDETWTAKDGTIFPETSYWTESEEEEYLELKAFIEEAEGYGDFRHGETLILESYFEKYSRELAEDIGAISGDETWPLNCIDWERAAEELKQDYSEFDFGGYTYLMRD